MYQFGNLLSQFLAAKDGAKINQILIGMGDSESEVNLNEEFGGQWCWAPLGERPTNVATIELSTNPVRSIVERINNSLDALVDARLKIVQPPFEPGSPLEAAKSCFGRPTQPKQLVQWFDELEPDVEAERLSVVLQDGASREQPRVDIIDAGSGIQPKEFRNTILSLNRGNKMRRPFSLGIWGQGGSGSCAFASHVLYVSRSVEEPDSVGFTLVRRCKIAGWRECCYVALMAKMPDGGFDVPRFNIDPAQPLDVFESTGTPAVDSKLPRLTHGTLVRHYDYKLPNAVNEFSTSQRNLYHALQYLLPDPLLPYRLTDCRAGQLDHRHMAGSKGRLMKLMLEVKKRNKSTGIELKHAHGPELIAPPGCQNPCIEARWWVLFSWRKNGDGVELRSGAEQFAEREHPIQFVYNGQSHGELTTDVFKSPSPPHRSAS